MSSTAEPIACRLTDAEQARRLAELRETVCAAVDAVREEPDGVECGSGLISGGKK